MIDRYGFLSGALQQGGFCQKPDAGARELLLRRDVEQAFTGAILHIHAIRCSEELTWSEDLLFNLEYIRYAARFLRAGNADLLLRAEPAEHHGHQAEPAQYHYHKATLLPITRRLYEDMGLYEQNKLQIFKYLVSTAEA